MRGFKGFDKDLKCKGFQYEVGKEYKEDEAWLCKKGFHFCENPIDVFCYYPPSDSRYCTVEAEVVDPKEDYDSKRCSKAIKIGTEIGIEGIVKAGVEFIFSKVNKSTNTGDQSAATNTGDQSVATNTGVRSAATNTGYQSAATVSRKASIAHVDGFQGKAKGALGCGITIAERNEEGNLINLKSAIVDGITVKSDTFYTLVKGEFVEVTQREGA